MIALSLTLALSAHAEKGTAQKARFEQPLAGLEKLLQSGKSPGDVVDALAASNARILTFQLEGLCKMYSPLYDKFEGHHDKFKELEDKLGYYVDLGNHIKYAEAVKAPKTILDHLKKLQAQGKTDFATYLKDNGWLGRGEDDPLPRLRHRIEKTEWLHYAEDREYMVKEFNKQAKKIQNTTYDMSIVNDPEKPGLHKFRRDVRWLLLWAQAVNGLVLLDPKDNPLKEYEHLLREPIADSPYVRLPPSRTEKRPLYLPKSLFVALTVAVERLGDLKDIGEAEHEWLHDAIRDSGYRGKDHDVKLAELLAAHPKHVANYIDDANKIYAEIHDGPILGAVRDAIKEREYRCNAATAL